MSENKTSCADVEDLLIRKGFEPLTDRESRLLMEHLQACERCRSLQNLTIRTQTLLDISSETGLTPDPSIAQAVRRRMRSAARAGDKRDRPVWGAVLRVLQHRIPVYQAVLGAVVITAVWVGVKKQPAPRPAEFSRPEKTQEERPGLTPQKAPDRLSAVDRPQVGRTIREDSLLAKFIVSAF
jgi:hypothetical protein